MRIKRKNKYLGLKVKPPVPAAGGQPPTRLTFVLKAGRRQTIDLTFFELGREPRKQMAETFALYFWHALKTGSAETRAGNLYVLRNFNKFLDWRAEGAGRISSTSQITTALLLEYQLWLTGAGGVSRKTAHKHYSCLCKILRWTLSNRPGSLPHSLRIPPSDYSSARYEPGGARAIGVEDLEKIAEAAVKEVRQVRENHSLAKKLLTEGHERLARVKAERHLTGRWKTLPDLLFYLVNEVGIESSPPRRITESLRRSGLPSFNSVLNMYVPVSERSFVPFLVLLFIRTAINVESLYHLKRDCLREHPLPLGLTVLEFDKPRSGSARNKMLDFPTHQKNGVVDLIRFLIEYTSPLIPLAREAESEELFLFKSPGHGANEVRSPGANFGMRGLKKFIEQNNLPHFTFAQIRPTIATLIYLQTRDIFRVRRLLCHTNVTVTLNYIKPELTHRRHDTQIRDGIESILRLVMDAPARIGKPAVFVREIDSVLESKVGEGEVSREQASQIKNGGCATGVSRCRDPYDSPIPGEQKGRLCRQLHMCLFCPNAWVFEEDLPKVIYYRDSLLAERKELTEASWDELHGDAFRAITEEILPSFSTEAVEHAAAKAKEMFAPYPRPS